MNKPRIHTVIVRRLIVQHLQAADPIPLLVDEITDRVADSQRRRRETKGDLGGLPAFRPDSRQTIYTQLVHLREDGLVCSVSFDKAFSLWFVPDDVDERRVAAYFGDLFVAAAGFDLNEILTEAGL